MKKRSSTPESAESAKYVGVVLGGGLGVFTCFEVNDTVVVVVVVVVVVYEIVVLVLLLLFMR